MTKKTKELNPHYGSLDGFVVYQGRGGGIYVLAPYTPNEESQYTLLEAKQIIDLGLHPEKLFEFSEEDYRKFYGAELP